MAAGAVRTCRRTFILTLDRDRRHRHWRWEQKQNRFGSSFVPYRKKHRFPYLLSKHAFNPRCRASIRTLNGPLCGPITGVRFHAQVRHRVADLGARVLPSNRRSLTDQPAIRSHPNKAVECRFQHIKKKSALHDQQRFSSDCYAAVAAGNTWPRGSYTLRRSRADAVKPRVFAPLQRSLVSWRSFPRSHSFFPNRRKSVSGPNRPGCNTAHQQFAHHPVARLADAQLWLTVSESSCLGTNPRYGPTSRLLAKRSGFQSRYRPRVRSLARLPSPAVVTACADISHRPAVRFSCHRA